MFPAISLMVGVAEVSSRNVPFPLILLTVTLTLFPVAAETLAIVPFTVPVEVIIKSLLSKSFTPSLKFT